MRTIRFSLMKNQVGAPIYKRFYLHYSYIDWIDLYLRPAVALRAGLFLLNIVQRTGGRSGQGGSMKKA
jgi:hypothetical protein